MNTIGPLYSGKLNVQWDEKGMVKTYREVEYALL